MKIYVIHKLNVCHKVKSQDLKKLAIRMINPYAFVTMDIVEMEKVQLDVYKLLLQELERLALVVIQIS